mmetsp:Transcript_16495/g.24342  ORF Transcript_16495/g.24342 Transcript_16495/m.24342 type:complete len:159 (-) Transcript_16495:1268-1744(-)
MNIALVTALFFVSSNAFSPTFVNQNKVITQRSMFSGGGEGAVLEDDPEKLKQMEAAAKSMGMSVEEYQLGISARNRFTKEINDLRISTGDDDIGLEVDGNSLPEHLVVKISEAGKAKGKEAISSELKVAFEKAAVEARAGRVKAQQNMMKFIQETAKA